MLFVLSDSPFSHQKVASQIAKVLSQHIPTKLVLGRFSPSILYDTVLIVCSPHGLTNLIMRAISRNRNIKKIIFYATNEGRLKPDYLPKAQYLHKGILITPSEFCKKNFEEDGFTVHGIIPHGVEWFGQPKEKNKRIFGYMGGGLCRKYPPYGVNAVKKTRINFKVIVDNAFRRVITRNTDISGVLEQLGYKFPDVLDKRVLRTFAEIVSENEYDLRKTPDEFIIDFYKSISFYLNLSDSEGFGITPLEALAMGCVVIAPKYAPLTEFLPDFTLWIPTSGKIWIENWWNWLLIQHHHYYEHEAVKVIKKAFYMKDSVFRDLSKRGIEYAKKYDINKVYVRFLDYV